MKREQAYAFTAGLPTPKRYLSVYERKHIETAYELKVPVFVYGWRLNAQVVHVYKLKWTRVKMASYHQHTLPFLYEQRISVQLSFNVLHCLIENQREISETPDCS